MVAGYVKHRRILLKAEPAYNEAWVQQRIVEDPGLLGLGDLDVRDQQRSQPRAGRLDMLLLDPLTQTRYELELQLGSTDESHIIRTIEYWDIERKRYPQYDHVGIIVAEEITARFFNVISLFNGFIPLVAIQMNAVEVNGAVTLVFTKVLDWVPLGLEEDEGAEEPRDRTYWENKASMATLKLTDELLELVKEVEPGASLKYNKFYIGLARSGVPFNFVLFRPRRQHIIAEFKIPRSDELAQRLEESSIDLLTYSTRSGRYRMRLEREDLERSADLLRELVKQARDTYGD
jgi:hypothetical protein